MLKVKSYKDKKKEWRWHIVAANGEIIACSSEGYKRRIDARHGFELIIRAGRTVKRLKEK